MPLILPGCERGREGAPEEGDHENGGDERPAAPRDPLALSLRLPGVGIAGVGEIDRLIVDLVLGRPARVLVAAALVAGARPAGDPGAAVRALHGVIVAGMGILAPFAAMLRLRADTSPEWVRTVLADFNSFLIDHAACERKASATALAFVVRYPDRRAIIDPLIDLAREELAHFHECFKLIDARGLELGGDAPDPYVNALLAEVRSGGDARFLDRLLVSGIIEARGCERFGLVGEALPEGELKRFYEGLAWAEARHHGLFVRLARPYFDDATIEARLSTLLDVEADVVRRLALRPAVH